MCEECQATGLLEDGRGESQAHFEACPSTPPGLRGPHPTPSREGSDSVLSGSPGCLVLRTQHPPSTPRVSRRSQGAAPPLPSTGPPPLPPGCPGKGPQTPRGGRESRGWSQGCLKPRQPRAGLSAWPSVPEAAASCQVGDWCQLSMPRQVAPQNRSLPSARRHGPPLSRGDPGPSGISQEPS